ncbi:hypothetical protein DAPPUDRAFT_302128 [Daphnia pulex]|uniref:Cysteine protease n=1 Tax=Daphnia pulex TaxID=6669 RepID=E9GBM8_DAPPU|nr:hypothetical protein DAPPUDRAFT_302128 [Daphnia pulex]|eukprot:EFX82987.1 hypothetical protein DAPPUDRAFT_302128 [Daphnia pulex]
MWNNVRYSWNFKTKTHFSKDSPIWLLGRIYHQSHKTDDSSSLPTNNFEALKSDFFSRIWLTYRKEFPVLNGSYYTSDCGWGCMLRSGQMLLAQALVCHFLGRDWRWNESGAQEQQTLQESLHRMIVQWFGDKPSPACPLSIHQMVSQGHISAGKRPGDWYGPSSVSYIIKQILQRATDTYPELDTLRVYIAQDCTVYLDDVKQSCSKICNYECEETDYELIDDQWKSLILLIPLRLGGERMNPTYDSCLKGLLSLEQCIGIIGGKPKHSQYFIGWQDDYLIHLDPHNCQEMVDVLIPNFNLKSFHCHELRKTALKQVDPSCCVGFYLRSQREFDEFRRNVQHYLVPPQSKGDYPIFAFSSGSSPHVDDAWFQQNDDSLSSSAARPSSTCGPSTAGDNYLDDFEIL